MCGINGIFAYRPSASAVELTELRKTRDKMATRGPDGHGEWISVDGRIALGHRRLAIIDLSDTGAQPMRSADGSLVITFNGEIYNYRALREALEARGHRFVTQSDTEVLLHLFAEKGEAMLDDLRGMFAFAIWDNTRQRLFLARDPYGIKPIYYCDDGYTLRFASQVKAIVAGGRISNDPDPAGAVGFYLWGSVPEPFTIVQQIRALPAGSYLVVDQNGVHSPVRYHSIACIYCKAEEQADPKLDAQEQIRAALLDSVRHHLIADVPVGAFLSAGIDSGALVGLMRDAGQDDIQTVTIAFEEFRGGNDDEAPQAAAVAKYYGTRHTNRIVTESEFRADLPRILEAMDQPSIDGINSWFVSKAAHELGLKVAISGLGGDELLGGYPSFQQIPRLVRALAIPSRIPLVATGVLWLIAFAKSLGVAVHPKLAGFMEFGHSIDGAYFLRRGLFMPWELDNVLSPAMVREGLKKLQPLAAIDSTMEPMPRSWFGKIATLESSLYMRNQLLRDVDWASMAHSLEVRVPLVDTELLRRVAPYVINRISRSAKEYLATAPARPLPGAILDRPKTGFSTPVGAWQQRWSGSRSAVNAPWARHWACEIANASWH